MPVSLKNVLDEAVRIVSFSKPQLNNVHIYNTL